MKKIILLMIFAGFIFISCSSEKKESIETSSSELSQADKDELYERAKQIFGKLPDAMPGSENDTPERISLGKKLFFDTRLSVNETQSCNTCHDVTDGFFGVDNKRVSPGAIEGTEGDRNSPTVLNAGYHFVQFWDGREADLKGQAKGPILNPVEMAMPSEAEVEKRFSAIPEYVDLFKLAYPDDKKPLNYDNLADAIAAFERTLISKSRFDDYMEGDKEALTNDEIRGMKTFMEVGCTTCHVGPLVGASMYQKMGLIKPYTKSEDLGRYDATQNDADKHFFKVPSLRNIAHTYPYFHDGNATTLDEAITTMADINLGKNLSDTEIEDIKSFLNALTDKDYAKGKQKVSL